MMRFLRRTPVTSNTPPSLADVAANAMLDCIGGAIEAGYMFRPDLSTCYAQEVQRLTDEIQIWMEEHMVPKGIGSID